MHDLALAIAHHLLVFSLAGILAFELGAVRRGMDAAALRRLASVDLWYGILAGLILVVGFSRAVFAAKGWAYYSVNPFFWAKIAAFLVVGMLSIWPTVAFIRWGRACRADAAFSPPDAAVRGVRRIPYAEACIFALIPVFAAIMARYQ